MGASHIGRGMAGQYSVEPGVIGYNELCEKLQKESSQWHVEWENDQKVPYAYNDRNWVGYDNEESISLKAEYVVKEDLAGIMVWSIESDDFRGTCGKIRYPLLTVINEILNGGVTRPAVAVGVDKPVGEPHLEATKPLNSSDKSPVILPPVGGHAQISPPGALQCQGKSGYIRDFQDCAKFYFCENDVSHSFHCPIGLFFDLKNLNCNYSTMVDC